ncbi:DUF6610 family protein [Aeromonas salmonicida]|uniref:DUF6610 family protein n=1 Tax=Aeromonas salmonicida TaxID=645 RepID=UPI0039A44F05
MEILKFIAHSKKAVGLATNEGWHPAARYTNMRDVGTFDFEGIGFVDIDWKNYDFSKHLDVVAKYKPRITMARDVECIFSLDSILKEAEQLLLHSEQVAIVPKDQNLNERLSELIPSNFILAYSVPTRYGGTEVSIESFDRPVHLLGGRPDVQRALADKLKVYSMDCNRFTYDARFGDYFDGARFRAHPEGGYERCILDSIININKIWEGYVVHEHVRNWFKEAV